MGNMGTMCKEGHDLTLPNAVYYNRNKTGNSFRRCRVCYQTYQRNIRRRKAGIPLDAPVRHYLKQNPRRPKPVIELINLIGRNEELAKYLLMVVRSEQWAKELEATLETDSLFMPS